MGKKRKFNFNDYDSDGFEYDPEANKRERQLARALRKKGLELRSDSRLCEEFIDTGFPDIAEVVNVMWEMAFFYTHTKYADTYEAKYQKEFGVDGAGSDWEDYVSDYNDDFAIDWREKREKKCFALSAAAKEKALKNVVKHLGVDAVLALEEPSLPPSLRSKVNKMVDTPAGETVRGVVRRVNGDWEAARAAVPSRPKLLERLDIECAIYAMEEAVNDLGEAVRREEGYGPALAAAALKDLPDEVHSKLAAVASGMITKALKSAKKMDLEKKLCGHPDCADSTEIFLLPMRSTGTEQERLAQHWQENHGSGTPYSKRTALIGALSKLKPDDCMDFMEFVDAEIEAAEDADDLDPQELWQEWLDSR